MPDVDPKNYPFVLDQGPLGASAAYAWASAIQVSQPGEPGDCGECNRPEQFAWDSYQWVGGAPVIRCIEHYEPAPGWLYDYEGKIEQR